MRRTVIELAPIVALTTDAKRSVGWRLDGFGQGGRNLGHGYGRPSARTLLPATATALFGKVASGVTVAGIGAHLGGVSQSASAGAGKQRPRDGSGVAENFIRMETICP